MKMKLLISTTLAAMVALVAPAVHANSVMLYAGGYEFGGGGEITAVSTPSFLANYSPLAIQPATGGLGFETDCVEVAVDASVGTQYSFTLSQTTTEGNQLTLGAAYLYYLFGKGLLGIAAGSPTYDYANTGPGRIVDAELFQSALWALMNQPNYFGQNLAANPYLQYVTTVFGPNVLNPSAGAFDVDVMQLWDYNNVGSPGPLGYQDQLVLVPDGGYTVVMLGAAITAMAAIGLRSRKTVL
jgi:hypothetical protein